jgi:chaperonin GroEL (HSP60 family)
MGWTDDEALEAFKDISPTGSVLDLSTYTKVDARTGGLYDSTPAVLEAIQNSISVAGLLSACGGVIAHPRDAELERTEARSTADFLRASNYNEANDRP